MAKPTEPPGQAKPKTNTVRNINLGNKKLTETHETKNGHDVVIWRDGDGQTVLQAAEDW